MNFMFDSINIGELISIDEAFDNGMSDIDDDIVIFSSAPDEEGIVHTISLTLWRKEGVVFHTFGYVLVCEDAHETQESALDPLELVDELPAAYQQEAAIIVEKWLNGRVAV